MEQDRIGVWEDHADHLCFEEIARAWSKVSADDPKMLTEALVSAFWRGEFETDGQSALFILLPPDSAKFERRPGNYATRGEVVVKVAEDLQSYVTADRKKSPILREVVAYMLYRPAGQRAIVSGYAADFAKWSDDKRDSAYPNWRAEHEDVYRAHSTTPFEQWPTGPVDMRYYCSRWCIRRHDFARWYCTSSLSAGAPLDSLWPTKRKTGEPHRTRAVVVAAAKQTEVSQKRARGPRPRKLKRAIEAMKKVDPNVLRLMLEKEMEAKWNNIAGRTCLRKARNIVLSGNSDK